MIKPTTAPCSYSQPRSPGARKGWFLRAVPSELALASRGLLWGIPTSRETLRSATGVSIHKQNEPRGLDFNNFPIEQRVAKLA